MCSDKYGQFSGRILAYHSGDRGSIPRKCKDFEKWPKDNSTFPLEKKTTKNKPLMVTPLVFSQVNSAFEIGKQTKPGWHGPPGGPS